MVTYWPKAKEFFDILDMDWVFPYMQNLYVQTLGKENKLHNLRYVRTKKLHGYTSVTFDVSCNYS